MHMFACASFYNKNIKYCVIFDILCPIPDVTVHFQFIANKYFAICVFESSTCVGDILTNHP